MSAGIYFLPARSKGMRDPVWYRRMAAGGCGKDRSAQAGAADGPPGVKTDKKDRCKTNF